MKIMVDGMDGTTTAVSQSKEYHSRCSSPRPSCFTERGTTAVAVGYTHLYSGALIVRTVRSDLRLCVSETIQGKPTVHPPKKVYIPGRQDRCASCDSKPVFTREKNACTICTRPLTGRDSGLEGILPELW